MQKIIYISNMRLPSELAHSFQIMKNCSGFASLGNDVTLLIPRRFNRIKGDFFNYYHIPPTFKIVLLPCIDILFLSTHRIIFSILSLSFYISAWFYMLFHKADFIYSRDFLAGFFFKDSVFEAHSFFNNNNWFKMLIWRRFSSFVVLTSFIKERLIKIGIKESKIIVSSDGVDLKDFENIVSSKEELGLPKDKKIIGYIGSLKTMMMEKGVSSLINSLRYLDDSFILCIVGGIEQDILFYKNLAKDEGVLDRIIFVGTVNREVVPKYLSSFDFLIAPFPENEHYKFFMSPLKIFEYMASGKPIIASDLPSIREVLNKGNSVLIKPSDFEALAFAIQELDKNKDLAKNISENALRDVQNYTWNIRAEKILAFLQKTKIL